MVELKNIESFDALSPESKLLASEIGQYLQRLEMIIEEERPKSLLNQFNIFHSEELNELFEAMAKAQGEMGKVISNETNPFFKAKYPTLDVVIDVYREPLAKNGLTFMQWSLSDGKMLNYLGHSSGQYIANVEELRMEKAGPQAHGSAYSYLRRYSAMGIMGRGKASQDDDGNVASGSPNTGGSRGSDKGSGSKPRKQTDDFQAQLDSQGTVDFKTSPGVGVVSGTDESKMGGPTPKQKEIIEKAKAKIDEADALSHLSNIWQKHGADWRKELPGKLILPVQEHKDQKREALKKAKDEKEKQRIAEREKNEKAEV